MRSGLRSPIERSPVNIEVKEVTSDTRALLTGWKVELDTRGEIEHVLGKVITDGDASDAYAIAAYRASSDHEVSAAFLLPFGDVVASSMNYATLRLIRRRAGGAGSLASISDPDDFTVSGWTKTNVTATANVDGVYDRLTETAVNAVHTVRRIASEVALNNSATVRFNVASGTLATARTWVYIEGNAGAVRAWFDLAGGVVGTVTGSGSSSILALGGGKFQCALSYSITSPVVTLGLATGDTVTSYLGVVTADVLASGASIQQIGSSQLQGGASVADPDDFTVAGWTKTAVTATANVDGVYDRLTETAANSAHKVQRSATGMTFESAATLHFNAAQGTLATPRTWCYLEGNSGAARAWFDLAGGVVGSTTGTVVTSSIAALGGGKFRCSMSYVPAVPTVGLGLATADGVSSYAGAVTADILASGALIQQDGGSQIARLDTRGLGWRNGVEVPMRINPSAARVRAGEWVLLHVSKFGGGVVLPAFSVSLTRKRTGQSGRR